MSPKRTRGTARKVTLASVARSAKVDPSVVSRVVNNDESLRVRDETRQRVLEAIDKLGYRPNAAARSLRTSHAGTLGLFIPDFANPIYAEVIAGAESAAADAGCVIVVGSEEAVDGSSQTYFDLLGSGRVDGLLLGGGSLPPVEQERLEAAGLPYLLLNRKGEDASRYVILDDGKAAQMAVDHLLALGHRAIALIGGPPRADTARRRRQGYLAAMKRAGIPAAQTAASNGNYAPQGGFDAFNELIAGGQRPTAVFVANLASAVGVLKAAKQLKIDVPRDMSVVAVHDLPLADYLIPSLTTVRMPLREMGAKAVELILTRTPAESIQETVSEPMGLVLRDSTAPPRRR